MRRWVVQAQIDGGQREGPTSQQLAEIKALKAKVRRLEQVNEIEEHRVPRRLRGALALQYDTLGVHGSERGLDVAGPAFCHQMVRSVTGCLLAVGRGRRPAAWTAEVLAARDRQAVGQVAPPHGLTLTDVSYDADET